MKPQTMIILTPRGTLTSGGARYCVNQEGCFRKRFYQDIIRSCLIVDPYPAMTPLAAAVIMLRSHAAQICRQIEFAEPWSELSSREEPAHR